jgi:hypothetical protein
MEAGVIDGRGFAEGEAMGLGVAIGVAAEEAATGWTRSNFFQVFQK